MALIAPRFRNDAVLNSCKNGTHRMVLPETGPAVRMVQEALIDLGFPVPPPGADGTFNVGTGIAVVAFKTARGIFPNDPVVENQTMTALDNECSDKPPPPFVDRDEWASWRNRGNIPRVGAFNFTRADELARRAAGRVFTFDPVSAWLPPLFQTALLQSLPALLDPDGSPAGPGSLPATWGAGPFDLYHCHVQLFTGGVIPVPPQLTIGALLLSQIGNLHNVAATAPGAVKHNPIWTAQFRTLLLSSGLLPQFTALGHAAIAAASPAQPLFLVWHSFELTRWRRATMDKNSPQRHWQTPVAPVLGPPLVSGFTEGTMNTVSAAIFQISFYISKAGVISAMPGGGLEAAAMVGITQDELDVTQF